MNQWVRRVFRGLGRLGRWVEDALLAVLLSAMILLATAQIVMRNFLDSGFIWGDELLRIMVLWLGLVGAMVASREDKHITIDVFSKFLPPRMSPWVRAVVDIFTVTVCWVIAWSATSFVKMEAAYGSTVLGGLPAWIFQAVIPFGFGIIGLRYGVFFVRRLRQLRSWGVAS